MHELFSHFFVVLGIIIILTVFVFIVGGYLALFAEKFAQLTNLSGALVGFILVAVVTSIPEAVSTFLAVSIGSFNLAAGGIFGSNAANLALLSAIFLYKRQSTIYMTEESVFSFFSSLILLSFVGFFMIFDFHNSNSVPVLLSIVSILVLYGIIMIHSFKLSMNSETPEDKEESPVHESLVHVVSMLILFSVLIVTLSGALVYSCEILSQLPFPGYGKPLGQNFIGALLLAVATSVPELATTFQIVMRGNTSMAIGNIAGSNTFNLMILTVSNFLTKDSLWNQISSKNFYTIFVIFTMSILLCMISFVKESRRTVYFVYIFNICIWIYSLALIF